jgi:hypothetical protein
MQIRGRSERRAFQDSFIDIFAMRLLYPSNGGYMYPIRGLIKKADYRAPWVLYDREDVEDASKSRKDELYTIIAALPASQPPDPNIISKIFLET